MCNKLLLIRVIYVFNVLCGHCRVWNILQHNIIPSEDCPDESTSNANRDIVNYLLNNNVLSGDTLLFPNKSLNFWFNGGLYASSLKDITIQIDATINFQNNPFVWPKEANCNQGSFNTHKTECICFENSHNITFTSSNGEDTKGLINGHGEVWWGWINYVAVFQENRPRLLHVYNSTNIKIEYIYFKNSPYWNVFLEDVKNVEIHHSNVSAKWQQNNDDFHDTKDIQAFNTDGFDIAGENVYIHNVDIWNADDCIAVKKQTNKSYQSDCSRNMLFENITASGLGLTIGSIPPNRHHSCVHNITFRNAFLKNTIKGIYMKSEPGSGSGSISNVLYENITIQNASDFSIWIGPQQAIYSGECSLLWPVCNECPVSPTITWTNITLRNVTIVNSTKSPGVILGNDTNPMKYIKFENVIVKNEKGYCPWGQEYYKCFGVLNFTATDCTGLQSENCTLKTQELKRNQTCLESSFGVFRLAEIAEGFDDITNVSKDIGGEVGKVLAQLKECVAEATNPDAFIYILIGCILGVILMLCCLPIFICWKYSEWCQQNCKNCQKYFKCYQRWFGKYLEEKDDLQFFRDISDANCDTKKEMFETELQTMGNENNINEMGIEGKENEEEER